ncbi:hypothetical protein DQ353_00295 [Arthrobacter sp. AQ5-05]|uniref:hypothetical protein n=1 Tax=Arthrobacter sp. AQ5-05 TaxID=2184581 RepID=UPI000DCF19B9|nr:hypothetical protein [Arthrobacter sp. AQ5-05]RAX50877.1 hypothetical protein DQ353_00295 [Arthrobacter sp. AQ5-05]
MSTLAALVAGALIGAVIVILLVVGAAHRKSEQQLMDHYIEIEEKKAQSRAFEKRIKAMPWHGTDLNSGVDISCTVTAEDVPRWQVGDEFVAIPAPGGYLYVSKAYADRMGIQGQSGKVVDG